MVMMSCARHGSYVLQRCDMNKAMRWLALAGASVAAGAMIGTGPVQAAPAGPQANGAGSGTSVQNWDDEDYIFGPFRNKRSCTRFGIYGDKTGAWDRFYCFRTFYPGSGRGWYLKVQEDYWQWDNWDGIFTKGWPYRPKIIGGPLSFDYPNKHYYYKNYNQYKKYTQYPDLGGGSGYPLPSYPAPSYPDANPAPSYPDLEPAPSYPDLEPAPSYPEPSETGGAITGGDYASTIVDTVKGTV
jgi:hypothetical protein